MNDDTIEMDGGRIVKKHDDPTKYIGESMGRSHIDKTVSIKKKKQDGPMYFLIQQEGSHPGTVHRLKLPITSIGRGPDNEIQLASELVSKNHAKIRIDKDKIVIRDLLAENPTLVNGEEIESKTLQENDRITFGDFVLVLKIV